MSHSPHLPPKACSVPAYYVRQSLPWIFVVVTIAMLSGIAAGLATAAWVLPSLQTSDTTGAFRGGNKLLGLVAPDVILQKTVSQRTLTIYDTRFREDDERYAESAALGQAVVLSSDGWLVTARYPEFGSDEQRYWELIDFQGMVYTPTETIVDPLMGLVYIRIDADGLPIISFRQQPRVQAGDITWAWDRGNWQQAVIGHPAYRADTRPDRVLNKIQRHTVSSDVPGRSFLTDNQGYLAGIVTASHDVIDIDAVQRQLAPLLQNGALRYTAANWSGYLVEGKRIDDTYVRQSGFYIVSADTLEKGDVVTFIDGKPVRPRTLQSVMLDAPETFSAIVLRDGEEIVVEISKQELNLDELRTYSE